VVGGIAEGDCPIAGRVSSKRPGGVVDGGGGDEGGWDEDTLVPSKVFLTFQRELVEYFGSGANCLSGLGNKSILVKENLKT